MEKMQLYESVRACPNEALREILAGRLKGKSDINPMWRIKTLTEQFGPCGVGWKYEITEKRLERGNGPEIAAFVDINLYIKTEEGWSEAIPGMGGSMFVASERNGPYTSDECFKMALTDAISVACKALGVAADVYWDRDTTKYSAKVAPHPLVCDQCGGPITPIKYKKKEMTAQETADTFGLCLTCIKGKYNVGA